MLMEVPAVSTPEEATSAIVMLPLADLRLDAGTQVRVKIDEALVAEFAERMLAGDVFPPVSVFEDEGVRYLSDGFHRCAARVRAGFTDVEASIQTGTPRDAVWFALGANRAHGLRLAKPDKQHAVRMALQMWPERLVHEIAAQVGCSRALVSQVISKANGGERGIFGRNLVVQRKRAAVRERVLAGEQSIDIQRALNVGSEMIADIRREEGLAKVDYSRKAVKGRIDKVRELAEAGHSSRQIAAIVGLSEPRVRANARRLGIKVVADEITKGTHRHDPNRIVSRIVMDAENLMEGSKLIDYAALDAAQIPEWIASLKKSRRFLTAFIERLSQEHQHGEAVVEP